MLKDRINRQHERQKDRDELCANENKTIIHVFLYNKLM